MLRITTNDKPRVITFQLEGKLEGQWVSELERCWRDLLNNDRQPSVRVDLTGVTHISATGKARLAEMHEHGAEFITGDCMTTAVVAEIVAKTPSNHEEKGTHDEAATCKPDSTALRKIGHSRIG